MRRTSQSDRGRRDPGPLAARTASSVGVAFAILLAACDSRSPEPARPASATAPPPKAPAPDPSATFAGAAECASCHETASLAWARSPHGRHGTFAAEPSGGADSAVGAVWMQAYLRRDDSGLERIVPTCRDLRAGTWLDVPTVLAEIGGRWTEPASAPPIAAPIAIERRAFETDCAGCHASQPTLRLASGAARLEGRRVAASIDCETCHGAGLEHAREWQRLSAGKPLARLERLSPRAQVAVCGRCHGGPPTEAGFAPADGDAFVTSIADRRGFFPDGRAAGQVYQMPAFVSSPCHTKGGLVCTDCHDPHGPGLRRGADLDGLCVRCHAGLASAAHTHHAPVGTGARCVECHMPRLLSGLMSHQRDHRISTPLPAVAETPDACTACHRGKTKEWADRAWRGWWGEPPDATIEAVRALAGVRLGRVDAAALRRAERHPDPFVRANAARALTDPTPLLDDPAPEVRVALAEAAPMNVAGEDALCRLAKDREPRVRAAAAVALAARGSKDADTVSDEDLALAARHLRDDPWPRLVLAERERRRGRPAAAAAWSVAAFLARPFATEMALTAAADLLRAGDAAKARTILSIGRRLAPDDDARKKIDEVVARMDRAAERREGG